MTIGPGNELLPPPSGFEIATGAGLDALLEDIKQQNLSLRKRQREHSQEEGDQSQATKKPKPDGDSKESDKPEEQEGGGAEGNNPTPPVPSVKELAKVTYGRFTVIVSATGNSATGANIDEADLLFVIQGDWKGYSKNEIIHVAYPAGAAFQQHKIGATIAGAFLSFRLDAHSFVAGYLLYLLCSENVQMIIANKIRSSNRVLFEQPCNNAFCVFLCSCISIWIQWVLCF